MSDERDSHPDAERALYTKEIEANAQAVAKSLASFAEFIVRADAAFKQVQAAVSRVAARIDEATKDLAAWWVEWLEAFRRWHEEHERVLGILAPRGWLLSPTTPPRNLGAILALYDSDGIDAVENALLELFDDDACAFIVEGLGRTDHLRAWAPTLAKALAAHQEGDYELAIPIWLIAIDGLCRAALSGADPYGLQSDKGPRADRIRRQLVDEAQRRAGLRDAEVDALLQVFTGMGGYGDVVVLNRNEILHGARLTIGSQKDSVQAIIVLETLVWLIALREVKSVVSNAD